MSKEKTKVKKLNFPILSRAKSLAISDSYIITFTGKKANIFDKNLNLLYTISDLQYVYHGYISPDESKLLMVSTANIFYVFSLDNFECLKKYSFKGRFNYNLEGHGAWEFDGKTFLINATDKYSLHTCIMYFSLEQEEPIKQIELPKYNFQTVNKIEQMGKFLFAGLNYEDEHKNYLFYFSGDVFEEYPIEKFDDVILSIEYNNVLDCLIIYGANYSIFCSKEGKFIKPIETQKILKKNLLVLNNWLGELKFNKREIEEIIDSIFDFIGKDNQDSFENINKLIWSNDEQLIYGATSERFFIYDKRAQNVIFSKNIAFGVYDIIQLCNNKLLLATWNGILIYEINNV